MKAETFLDILQADFFTGVPDSRLRPLTDTLMARYGVNPARHVVAANEGNAAALAAGYHLATGKIPVVYLQNSGEGNEVNPAASLLHPDVYGIPVLFVMGWRGEPDLHDEPQHLVQGGITLPLLDLLGISHAILDAATTEEDARRIMDTFRKGFASGRSAAFVVREGGLTADKRVYANSFTLRREEALRELLRHIGPDPVFCSTGKASRELYELRDALGQGHERDFLTVGSMGHTSSIALGYANAWTPPSGSRVWCLDGDGSALMHLGSMAVIGAHAPRHFLHVVINNAAHESVGGIPSVMDKVSLTELALACGYTMAKRVETLEALRASLPTLKKTDGPVLVEICCALGARADLGRPVIPPQQSKCAFMKNSLSG